MHIPRNPVEQIDVDWAGVPAHIIDPDTGETTDAWIFIGVMTYSQYAFVEVNNPGGVKSSLPARQFCHDHFNRSYFYL